MNSWGERSWTEADQAWAPLQGAGQVWIAYQVQSTGGCSPSKAFFLLPGFFSVFPSVKLCCWMPERDFWRRTVHSILTVWKLEHSVSRKYTTFHSTHTTHSVGNQDMKADATNDLLLWILYLNYGSIGFLDKIQEAQFNLNFR